MKDAKRSAIIFLLVVSSFLFGSAVIACLAERRAEPEPVEPVESCRYAMSWLLKNPGNYYRPFII